MALTSGSTKAMLGIVVGALICVIHFIGYRPIMEEIFINMTTSFVTFAFLLVFLFLYTDELIFLAVQFFTENGYGRRLSSKDISNRL